MKLDFDKIPLDDKKTFELLSSGRTVGVFQLESNLGQNWSKRLKPENFEHIADLTSILRPSCLQCISGKTRIAKCLFYPKRHKNHFQKKYRIESCSIEDLYNQNEKLKKTWNKEQCGLKIVSLNEKTRKHFTNTILDVYKCGKKDVYKPLLKWALHSYADNTKQRISGQASYNLECTLDHKLLTLDRGWQKLSDLKIGEYLLVNNSIFPKKSRYGNERQTEKNFRSWCFYHYKYECLFCDWKDGSLDTNHINGNRKTNNHPDNLCFLCPNHHRMFTEGTISKEEVLEKRPAKDLFLNDYVRCVQYMGKELVDCVETYDISVEGPNNNYIAGNFIVHNSGNSDSYVNRKNGKEPVEYDIPELEPILKNTYGVSTYQEDALSIAQKIAGFTEVEADLLRISVSKKLADKMAEIKPKFIKGCKDHSDVDEESALKIFDFIEKGQRYSFSKLHATGYGILTYYTAYAKAHYPTEFYCSYLTFSKNKPNPHEEIENLIEDSRHFGVEVTPPDIRRQNKDFAIISDKTVAFGLSSIKGIGSSSLDNIFTSTDAYNSWCNFLLWGKELGKRIWESLIKSGACDCFNMSRKRMMEEMSIVFGDKERTPLNTAYRALTKKELPTFMESWSVSCSMAESLQSIIDQGSCTKVRKPIIEEKIKIAKNCEKIEDSNAQNSAWERIYLGISLTCSAADDHKDGTHRRLSRITDDPQITRQKSCIVIDKISKRKTKKDAEYIIVDISDNSASEKWIPIWPRDYEKIKNQIYVGAVCEVIVKENYWQSRRKFTIEGIKVF